MHVEADPGPRQSFHADECAARPGTVGAVNRAGSCPPGAAALVVLAGGSGNRVGAAVNKVYLPLAGRPVLAWSLAWAREVPAVGPVVLVRRPQDATLAAAAVAAAGPDLPVEQVRGGATRAESEAAALAALRGRIAAGAVRVVAIHDGARPLAGAGLLAEVIEVAMREGGAVPTVPVEGVWRVEAGALIPPTGGLGLHRVQTPQAFRAPELLAAYDAAARAGSAATDTAGTVQAHSSLMVRAVPGSPGNLKLTFAADLELAARLLG